MADDIEIGIGVNPTNTEQGSSRAKSAIKGVSSEADQLQAAFKRLKASIDPMFSATEKYNQALADNQRLLQAKLISDTQAQANELAAAAALDRARTAVERKSQAYKDQQAATRAAAAQEKADAAETAAAVASLAAQKAAAEKAAKAEERQAAREAAAQERADAAETAAAVKALAQQKAQAERQAAADELAATKAARKQEAQDARDAAQAAQAAAKQKRQADRDAVTSAREAAQAERLKAIAEKQDAAALMELRSQIDPVFAAQTRYNQTMAAATSLLMQNKLQEGEWIKIQKNAATQMDINTRSLGRQNSAYTNMGYQMQDVVASVASGINPLVILAQQGGQVASAMEQAGGKGAGFARFMAGPFGAAILGAVLVLGMVIPKLFDFESASDRAARSQENLKNYIDSTTGAIKAQITQTQLLAAAQNEAEQAKTNKKISDTARRKLSSGAQAAVLDPGVMSDAPVAPTITNPKTQAAILDLSKQLDAGSISIEGFMKNLRSMGKSDVNVANLAKSLTKVAAGAQDADLSVRKNEAEMRRYLGTATEADLKLLGVAHANDVASKSYLDAAATAATTTDAVVRAKAKQTMAESDADDARKKALATGVSEKKANEDYVKSVAPYIAAVEKAEAAKKAASAAAAADRRQARKEETEAEKAAREAQKYAEENFDYQREQAEYDFGEQERIQQAKINSMIAFYGKESKEVEKGERELAKLRREEHKQELEEQKSHIAAMEAVKETERGAQHTVTDEGIGAAEDQIQSLVQRGVMNQRQALLARKELLAQEYAEEVKFEDDVYNLKVKALQDQLALIPKTLPAYKSTEDAITQEIARHNAAQQTNTAKNFREQNKLNLEAANQSVDKWKIATDSVAGSFSTMFQGIWTHSHQFKQNMFAIADNLVFKYFDMGAKMVADWAANELAKLGASLMATKLKTAAVAAGAATDTAVTGAAAGAEIAARGATAAAGAYSSTVVIPFIGPVSAPIAAAVALAAVLGFGSLISAKGGMGEVPGDQLAMVHKKEMILPAWIAEPMRKSLSAPTSGRAIGGAMIAGADARAATHMSSQGDTNFHYNPIHNNGGEVSMASLLKRDGEHMRKWLRNEARNRRT